MTVKIIKKVLCAVISILIFQVSYSQKNYLPGYIINLDKDTIKGFVDYKNWNTNPDKINFKKGKDLAFTTYSQNDVIEFGVKDEIYVRAVTNIETSPMQTDKLQDYADLNLQLDTIFLQTLYKGPKSLYYYKSNQGKDNFYIKNGQEYELLIYKKYTVEQTDNLTYGDYITNKKENNKYKGQLSHYLRTCSSVQSKLAQTEYEQKSLEKLFKHYYNCTGENIFFQKRKEKTAIEVGVLAGISSSKIKFNGDIHDYLSDAQFNRSINFTAGMFLEVFFSRNRKKWSLNNELVFSSYKFTGEHESFSNETGAVKTTSELGYSYLKMNNLLRYKIGLNQNR